MRVLIADHSPNVIRQLETELKAKGCELVHVTTGPEAMDQLLGTPAFDVALVDWQLAELSGLEVCRRMRASETWHRTVFFLLSVGTGELDQLDAYEVGIDGYILKPFSAAVVHARVHAAERLVAYQRRLLRHVGAEVLSHPPEPDTEEEVLPTEPEPPPHAPAVSGVELLNGILSPQEIEKLVAPTLTALGLTTIERDTEAALKASFPSGLGALQFHLLTNSGVWLDYLLETDLDSAQVLFERFTHTKDVRGKTAELSDTLRELLNLIQATLRGHFRYRKVDPLVPVVPQGVEVNQVSEGVTALALLSRLLFQDGKVRVRFSVFAQHRPMCQKTMEHVGLGCVLAEPLRLSDDSDMVLINRGVLVEERHLPRIENLRDSVAEGITLSVFEPSRLAQAMMGIVR